jgi:CHAT domain-containing protein
LLYESLFDSEVDSFFKHSLDKVVGSDRLRLQLVFRPDAFDLANIPWEFLYYPDRETQRGFFLATHPHLVLSRYIPLAVDRSALKSDEKPLRFLVVSSQPKSLEPVLAYPVVEAIQKLCETYPIHVETLDNPTIESFIENVEEFKPHILHFMGHGRFDQNKNEGQIALLKSDGETTDWVTDRSFAEYFERTQPRLVLLQACQGGAIDFTNNFAGLAPQLIRMGIPAVAAMQYPVTNKTAIDFGRAFYKMLAQGEPVDGAVQEGRRRITLVDPNAYSSRDFGTPVLYMHSRDGLIMPEIKASEVGQWIPRLSS